jgi:hypothetical protein
MSIDELEQRLRTLEPDCVIPGTILQRVLLEEGGIGWTLAIGQMQMPKEFYSGRTIESCLQQAETARDNLEPVQDTHEDVELVEWALERR